MAKLMKSFIALMGLFFVCVSAHAYTLRVDSVAHGNVLLSKTTAEAGDTLSLLVINDDGYWVDHMVLMDDLEDVLPIRWDEHNQGINRYYITMPACDVTIRPCFRVFAPVSIRTHMTNGRLSVDWERGYMENEWELVISEGDAIEAKAEPFRVTQMHYEQELKLNTQYTMLIRAWLDSANYSDWVNVGDINGPSCKESYRLLLDDYSYQSNTGWVEAIGHDGEVVATYRVPVGENSAEFDMPSAGVARYVYRKGEGNDIFRFFLYSDVRCFYGPHGVSYRYQDGETIYSPYDCNLEYCPRPYVGSFLPVEGAADSAQLTIEELADSVELVIAEQHLNAAACQQLALTSGLMMHDVSIRIGGIRPGHLKFVYTRSYCGSHVSPWREQYFLLNKVTPEEALSPSSDYYDQSVALPLSESGYCAGVVDDDNYSHRYYRLSLTDDTFFTPVYETDNDGDDRLVVASDPALTTDVQLLPSDSLAYLPAGTWYMAFHNMGNWVIWGLSGDLEMSTYSLSLTPTEPQEAPVAVSLNHEEEGIVTATTSAMLYAGEPYHVLRRSFSLTAPSEIIIQAVADSAIVLLNGAPLTQTTSLLPAGDYEVQCLLPTGDYRLVIGRPSALPVMPVSLPFSEEGQLSILAPDMVYSFTAPADTTLQVVMDYAAQAPYAFIISSDNLATDTLLLMEVDRMAHLTVEAGHTYYVRPVTPSDYSPYRISMRYVPEETMGQLVLPGDSIHAFWQSTYAYHAAIGSWFERQGYVYSVLLADSMAIQPVEELWGGTLLLPEDYNGTDELSYYEGDTLAPGLYNFLFSFDDSFFGSKLDIQLREYSRIPYEGQSATIVPIAWGDTVQTHLSCDGLTIYRLRLPEQKEAEIVYVLNNDDIDMGFCFGTDSMDMMTGEYWSPSNIGFIYHVGEQYITLPADTDIYIGLIDYHGSCEGSFSWRLQTATTYRTLTYQPISTDTVITETLNSGIEPVMSGHCDQRDQCYMRIKGFDFSNAMTRGYSLPLQAGHTYYLTATFRPEEYGWTDATMVLLSPDSLTGHLDTIPVDDVIDYREDCNWTSQISHQIVFTPDRDGDYPLLLAGYSATVETLLRLVVREDPTDWQTLSQLLAAADEERLTLEDLPQYLSGSFSTAMLPVISDSLFAYGIPEMNITYTYTDSVEQEGSCWNYDLQEYVDYTYMVETGDPIIDTAYTTYFDGVHYAVARAISLRAGDQWTATGTSIENNLLMIYYRDREGHIIPVACSDPSTLNQYSGIAQHTTTYYAVLTTYTPLDQTGWNLTLSEDRYTYLRNPAFGLVRPHITLLGSDSTLTFTHMPTDAEWQAALADITFIARFGDVAELEIPNVADDWTVDASTMEAVYRADANWLYGEYEWDDAEGVHTVSLRVAVALQSADTLLTMYAIPTEQDLRSLLSTVRLEVSDDSGVILQPSNHAECWTVDLASMSAVYTAPESDLPLGYTYAESNRLSVRAQVETSLTAGQESLELTSLPDETLLIQQVQRVRLYADARGEQVAALDNNPAQWLLDAEGLEVRYTAFDRELPRGYVFAAGKNTLALPVRLYLDNLSVRPDRVMVEALEDSDDAVRAALCEVVITLYAGTTAVTTMPNTPECWVIDAITRVASYICPTDALPEGYYNTGKQLRTAVEYTVPATPLPDVIGCPASELYYRLGIWLLRISDGKKEILLGQ